MSTCMILRRGPRWSAPKPPPGPVAPAKPALEAAALPREANVGGNVGQGSNDERDVTVEIDAELFGAAVDVLPIDGAGEGSVLELLLDRGDLHAGDHPARPDERAGVNEA